MIHDITVMRLCNLSWVLHTGTVSGGTDVFSILLYQRYLVRTFVIICLSECWGFFFASQQDKRRADLMHERNVGPKPIVCYFLQTSMREKMNWVNSS